MTGALLITAYLLVGLWPMRRIAYHWKWSDQTDPWLLPIFPGVFIWPLVLVIWVMIRLDDKDGKHGPGRLVSEPRSVRRARLERAQQDRIAHLEAAQNEAIDVGDAWLGQMEWRAGKAAGLSDAWERRQILDERDEPRRPWTRQQQLEPPTPPPQPCPEPVRHLVEDLQGEWRPYPYRHYVEGS